MFARANECRKPAASGARPLKGRPYPKEKMTRALQRPSNHDGQRGARGNAPTANKLELFPKKPPSRNRRGREPRCKRPGFSGCPSHNGVLGKSKMATRPPAVNRSNNPAGGNQEALVVANSGANQEPWPGSSVQNGMFREGASRRSRTAYRTPVGSTGLEFGL